MKTRYGAGLQALQGDSAFMQSPEWQLVLRIVRSPGFAKSTLLANFLRYVCERKLQGREYEITEHQIGIHAFGRSVAYNPGDDNIVRNYARLLRQRLEQFYAEAGREERLRISIPRGSYVPQFRETLEPLLAVTHGSPLQEPTVPSTMFADVVPMLPVTSPPSHQLWRDKVSWSIAAAVLVLACFGTYIARRMWVASHPDRYTEFWNEVMNVHRPTMIILADSGIGILQDLTGERIHLHEYASDDFSALSTALAKRYPNAAFGADRYKNLTSTADVRSLLDLIQQPQFTATAPTVRFAHDVRMDELAHENAILVGGQRANLWVELFEPVSGFRFEIPNELRAAQLDQRIVWNKTPQKGEAKSYSSVNTEDRHINHSVLSFLPSLDGKGHVLLFQGGNMGATQAAADFATDRSAMEPILQRARREDGSLRSFEVLLETRVVGASSPKATVLLTHYGE